jgi:2-iminoacetate synthase ThiH
VETLDERLEHMSACAICRTTALTAFITGASADHTEWARNMASRPRRRAIPAHAGIARLVLDNFDNLQASWVTKGR